MNIRLTIRLTKEEIKEKFGTTAEAQSLTVDDFFDFMDDKPSQPDSYIARRNNCDEFYKNLIRGIFGDFYNFEVKRLSNNYSDFEYKFYLHVKDIEEFNNNMVMLSSISTLHYYQVEEIKKDEFGSRKITNVKVVSATGVYNY